MTVKTGTAWAGTFVTQDATGALATPSTGPAGVLYVDGTANAAEVTITGTNPYKFSVTLPALTAGQRVDMYITATIDGIATGNPVASEQADTALTSEVKTETAAILADTGTDGVLVSSGTGAKQISLDSGKVLLQATQTGVTIPTVTAVTNGVSIASAQTVATVTDVTNAVKISAGTGAGQLDFTSGVVKANLAQILGTALTETAGQIAAAFKKFFNVAAPTGTVNSLPDAVAGANGGLPTTNGTKVTQTVDLTAGQSIAANGGTVDTVTTVTNAPTGMALEATLTAIKGAGWVSESLTSIQTSIDSGVLNNQTIADGKLDVIDGIVDDIKIVTDQFVFTIANQVDANSLTGSAGVTAQQVRAEMDSNSTRFILIEQLLRNRMITDPTTGIMTLYDDAGNPLLSAQIFQDAAGTIPYQGQGVERRERLT